MKGLFVLAAFLACAGTGALIGYAQIPSAIKAATIPTDGVMAPLTVHKPGSPPVNLLMEPKTMTMVNGVVKKVVYLTFDDGPTPGYTNVVLADLKAAGAVATFFEVGTHMQGNRVLMNQLLAAGNQLGTHTWSHADLASLTLGQVQNEITSAVNLQGAYTGHNSKLFRFPYFIEGPYGAQVAKALGLHAVWADVDPSDWRPGVSDAQVITTTMAEVYAGATVDLHDGQRGLPGVPASRATPTYLPALLADLKTAGYTFGTVQPKACGDGCNTKLHRNVCPVLAQRSSWFNETIHTQPGSPRTPKRRRALAASQSAYARTCTS